MIGWGIRNTRTVGSIEKESRVYDDDVVRFPPNEAEITSQVSKEKSGRSLSLFLWEIMKGEKCYGRDVEAKWWAQRKLTAPPVRRDGGRDGKQVYLPLLRAK